jgi:hypothetical protein
MAASITIQPTAVTNAYGLFNVQSQGYTQGDALSDPAVRFWLSGGVVSASATSPIWGGMPIQEIIPANVTTPGYGTLGSTVAAATNLATSTGICVFNQAYGGIISATSQVPLFQAGMSINFYRFGSGARIPLRCNTTLAAAIDGGQITQQVSYDFTNNWLTTYDGSNAFPVKVLRVSTSGNKTVSYNSGNGNSSWLSTENVALVLI